MLTDWNPRLGKYQLTCRTCGEQFHGRRNQVYCGPKCKAALNNRLAKARRFRDNMFTAGYLTNIGIIASELNDSEDGFVTVTENRLRSLGFDDSGPYIGIIWQDEEWRKVGPYAYRPIKGENLVELVRIDNHGSQLHD